jgi:hypothetical protein
MSDPLRFRALERRMAELRYYVGSLPLREQERLPPPVRAALVEFSALVRRRAELRLGKGG